MDISGKAKIWRRDVEGQNGTFYRYSTSISSRREDGTYASVYVPVRFARRANAPDKIPNGAEVDIKQGFLTVDEYKGKDGKVRELMLMVMSAKFPDIADEADEADEAEDIDIPDSYEQLQEDLPF